MKKIKYIFVAAALGLTMSSCYDLDLEPKGLIYENVLMKSESGLQKYWAMVFQDLPIEDFNFAMNGEHNGFGTVCAAGWHEANQWGAQKASPASAAMEATGRTTSYGDGWGYWPYDRIRDIFRITRNTIMKKHTKIFMLRPFSCGLFTTLDW